MKITKEPNEKNNPSADKNEEEVIEIHDLNKNFNYSKLNPKKLFELVLNNYESWQQSMSKQFLDEDNFQAFPQGDDDNGELSRFNDKPIFDYSILEQLERKDDGTDIVEKFNEVMKKEIMSPKSAEELESELRGDIEIQQSKLASLEEALSHLDKIELLTTKMNETKLSQPAKLNEHQMDILREKIADMISINHQDEEIDIDIDIIHNDGDEEEISEEKMTKIYEEGPSCEFTFEYDNHGKLISNNLPSINDLNFNETKQKKKKKKKNQNQAQNLVQNEPQSQPQQDSNNQNNTHNQTKQQVPWRGGLAMNSDCCLICEYEIVFGHKPKHLMKLYDQRVERDERRRNEIKTKLEQAKLKALKKQRELKQRQFQQLRENIEKDNLDGNQDQEKHDNPENPEIKSSEQIETVNSDPLPSNQ